MLRALKGKFTISEREVENVTPEDAMQIQYDPSVKSFTFSLHKIESQQKSLIVEPGMN